MDSPLWIGTAGWSVPKRYEAELPQDGSQLERYARTLNAVEINSSFYRPHQRTTYERWAESTPDGFRFSVKMPRTITHFARLKNCDAMLDRFLEEVTGLGDRLGVLLVQLPPNLTFDEQTAGSFFENLHGRIATPLALEPRNASWFAPEMDAWLFERKVARVAADPAKIDGAGEPGGWNGLIYYRWHGSPRIYYSTYDDAALAALKLRLDQSLKGGAEGWCIFDNTASGAAFGNALALMGREKASPLFPSIFPKTLRRLANINLLGCQCLKDTVSKLRRWGNHLGALWFLGRGSANFLVPISSRNGAREPHKLSPSEEEDLHAQISFSGRGWSDCPCRTVGQSVRWRAEAGGAS